MRSEELLAERVVVVAPWRPVVELGREATLGRELALAVGLLPTVGLTLPVPCLELLELLPLTVGLEVLPL